MIMKKSIHKLQRKELIKNRPISAQEIELSNALWESKVILGSEDLMWRSEVLDDTDFVIKSLLDLAQSCIDLNIREKHSKRLHAELTLHINQHNIEQATDKWLAFCVSLRDTEISDKAKKVEFQLNTYVVNHLKSRS